MAADFIHSMHFLFGKHVVKSETQMSIAEIAMRLPVLKSILEMREWRTQHRNLVMKVLFLMTANTISNVFNNNDHKMVPTTPLIAGVNIYIFFLFVYTLWRGPLMALLLIKSLVWSGQLIQPSSSYYLSYNLAICTMLLVISQLKPTSDQVMLCGDS